MIRKNAKVFALVLAIVMMLSTAAFAAEGDHFVNGKLKYSANQVRADVSAKNHVRVAPSEFQIEVEGKLYDLADANAAYAEDKANWKEILKGEDPSEDLKVVEVSAIEAITVTVGDDVDLPETVEVTLNDGNEEEEIEATVVEVAVEWEEFVAEEEGEFIVNGTIVLPEDAEFTISEELAAVTVTVVVEEAALEVVEVSAIKQTIAAGKDVDLKFEVNGKEVTKAEFDETYGEEDYTVKFLYNFDASKDNRAGKVNQPVGTFKYAVQVYLDGEEVNEVEAKDFVDVKVVDAKEAVSIEKVVLDNERDYLTTDETGIGFKVTEAKNALGEDLDEDSLEVLSGELEKVVSDDVTVAYVDGKTITARKAGKVTFTLTYYEDDKAIEVKLPVEVKEPGVATRVEAENQKVAAGTDVTELDFKVFDQHGLEIVSGYDVKVKDVDGKDADLSKKGIYTVEIIPTDKEDAIGSFTVTVVEVSDADIDEFKIVKANKNKKFEITVVDGVITKTPVDLNVEGYVDGVKVAADKVVTALTDNGAKFTLDIDEEVAKATRDENIITVTPVKAGTTTLELVKSEGDYKTVLASFEVTVESKVKAIDKLTLKEDAKVLIGSTERTEDLVGMNARKQAVVDAVKADIAVNQIAKVELVEAQDLVIVTITDDFGGKEFTLDAEYIDGTVVRTAVELRNALVGDVETIVLGDDISLTDHLDIRRSVVLDGKGNTITAVFNKVDGALIHLNADNVTIKNVTITTAEDKRMMGIDNTGRIDGLIIERVTFKDMELGFYSNGEINGKIEDCIFENLNKGIGYSHSPSFQLLFKDNIFRNIKSMYFEIFGEPTDEVVNAIIENNVFLYKDIEVAVIVDDEGNIVATEV